MALFQTVPVDVAINRLRRLNRRDVKRRALGRASDEAHWTSLMIDRTALLLPRVKLSRQATPDVLDETLQHLRLGHAAGRLREAMRDVEREIAGEGSSLLSAVAARFGPIRQPRCANTDLVEQTDALMARIAGSAVTEHARLLDLLTDLRFALATNGAGNAERGA